MGEKGGTRIQYGERGTIYSSTVIIGIIHIDCSGTIRFITCREWKGDRG